MSKKVILISVIALLMTQTAFAHDHRNYNDPVVAATLMGVVIGGVALLWAVMIRGKGFRPIQQAIFVLMTATAVIHLYVGIDNEWLLLLNGIGYMVLLFALFLPIQQLQPYRGYIMVAAMGYAAVTFLGYFRLHGIGVWVLQDWVGMLDKVLELALIVLAMVSLRQSDGVAISAD